MPVPGWGFVLVEFKSLARDEPQTGIYNIGLVQPTLILGYFLQGSLKAMGWSVWSVRGHGFDHIGNGKDLCLEHNIAGLQAARVT